MISHAQIRQIAQAGLLAPSGDNCQPWRLTWDGQRLDFHFVQNLAESLYDVANLASLVSLGAMLVNMRLEARRLGYAPQLTLLPGSPDNPKVASVQFIPAAPETSPLLQVLEVRCANRRPYGTRRLAPEVREELAELSHGTPGVSMRLIEDRVALNGLAAMASLNERILFEHRAFRTGLFRWLRWSEEEARRTGDGMPVRALELFPFERPGFRLFGSSWGAALLQTLGITRALPFRTRLTYQCSSAFLFFSIDELNPDLCVKAGEMLQRTWLSATARGLACQPVSGMLLLLLRYRLDRGEGFSRAHRAVLAKAAARIDYLLPRFHSRIPIMLLRIGHATAPSARTLRRPVDQQLTFLA